METTKRQYYFYFLRDPDTLKPRYFGKTLDIKRRLSQHISESLTCNTHKCNWIKSLSKPPVIESIYQEECTIEESVQIEKTLMRKFLKRYDLTNSWDNCVGAWKTGKMVYQYDLSGNYIKTFENANHARIVTGIPDSNILRSCKKSCMQSVWKAGGFLWLYEKYDKYPYPIVKNTVGKCVIQTDLNGKYIAEYKSAREAERTLGIGYKLISSVCTNYKKQTHGFKFRFKT